MKRNVYVGVLLTALLMTSCINTKRIVYLEDMKESLSYPMNAQPEMKIQRKGSLHRNLIRFVHFDQIRNNT